jgi:photosystem II stability/assembly factor-like uncharacterized protein
MNDDDLEADLRRVLADPGRRLPDTLVPLELVHAGARRRKARRQAVAAVAGASAGVLVVVAFVGISHLSHGPTNVSAGHTPGTSDTVSVSATTGISADTSPTASSSPSAVASQGPVPVPAGFTPVSVTAVNDQRWWVLGTGGQIAATTNAGRTFVLVSDSATSGLPSDAVEMRFADKLHGWAVSEPVNQTGNGVLWQTSDGGTTWQRSSLAAPVGTVELGGGMAYVLTQPKPGTWAVWVGAADLSTSLRPAGTLGSTYQMPLLAVQSGRAILAANTTSGAWVWRVGTSGTQRSTSPCDPSLGPTSISATVGSVWLTCANGSADSAWRSDDGSTWTAVPSTGFTGPATRMVVGAIDAQHAAIGLQSASIALVSAKGWLARAHGQFAIGGWQYLAFTNQSDGFALDDGNRLLRTTDGGATWTQITFG